MPERSCKGCDQIIKGQPLQAGQCGVCWRYWHDERFNRLWGGDGQVVAVEGGLLAGSRSAGRFTRPACLHLGSPTGETVPCPVCGKKELVPVPVLACGVHGRCTEAILLPQTACCRSCGDYRAGSGPGFRPYRSPLVRNLLMHVYPVTGNGVWQWNCDEVLKRIRQFNGRRIISIVTDHRTDSAAEVRAVFAGQGCEFLEFSNDPARGEVVSFEPLFGSVANVNPHEITYYCHAKGVRYPTPADRPTVRRWAEVMYAALLDHPSLVEQALKDHTFAGCFLKIGQGFEDPACTWHFSGTFFWLRNARVFGRDWKRICQTTWGIEAWPGTLAREDEAVSLFHRGPVPRVNVYSPAYWQQRIEPEWRVWQQARTDTSPPILIHSSGWDPLSGGSIALHRLCALLRQQGANAFMAMPDSAVPDPYGSPVASGADHLDPARVVIYPEVVSGNPLGARRVVRWLLNRPGAFGFTPTYGKDERTVTYARTFASDYPDAEPLFVFDLFPEHIHPTKDRTARTGSYYVVRKGMDKARLPSIDTQAQELTGAALGIAAFGALMRTAEKFYSYDDATWLSVQAALCGAESYVVPDPGVSAEAWRGAHWSRRYGINYGLDDPWGTRTRPNLPHWLSECETHSRNTVTRLLERLPTWRL